MKRSSTWRVATVVDIFPDLKYLRSSSRVCRETSTRTGVDRLINAIAARRSSGESCRLGIETGSLSDCRTFRVFKPLRRVCFSASPLGVCPYCASLARKRADNHSRLSFVTVSFATSEKNRTNASGVHAAGSPKRSSKSQSSVAWTCSGVAGRQDPRDRQPPVFPAADLAGGQGGST